MKSEEIWKRREGSWVLSERREHSRPMFSMGVWHWPLWIRYVIILGWAYWADLKLGAKNQELLLDLPLGDRGPVTCPSSSALQGLSAGSWTGRGATDTQTDDHKDAGIRQWPYLPCHKTNPLVVRFPDHMAVLFLFFKEMSSLLSTVVALICILSNPV